MAFQRDAFQVGAFQMDAATRAARWLGGQKFNLLERGTVTVSPGSDSLFGTANLYDGDASQPHRFSAGGAALYVQVDGNLTQNPFFAAFSGAAPDNWTKRGTGTLTNDAGFPKLDGSSNLVLIEQDHATVRSGEWMQIQLKGRGNGPSGLHVRVINVATNSHLAPDGTWTQSAVDAWVATAVAVQSITITFQMEGFARCGHQDLATLRVELRAPAGEVGWAEQVLVLPGVNFCGVFGHKYLEGRFGGELRSSRDAFASESDLQAGLGPMQPAFYGLTSALFYRRYWRLAYAVAGTGPHTASYTAPFQGEVVIGQARTLARQPRSQFVAPWRTALRQPQMRVASSIGRPRVYNQTSYPHADGITIPFRLYSETVGEDALAEREEIEGRCRAGAYPLIIIPDDTRPRVHFCRLPAAYDRSAWSPDAAGHDVDLVAQEEPFPQFGA